MRGMINCLRKAFLLLSVAVILILITACSCDFHNHATIQTDTSENTPDLQNALFSDDGTEQEFASEDVAVLQFFGSVFTDGAEHRFRLNYFRATDSTYYITLSIMSADITIPLLRDFNPHTVERGFQICDVNSDGDDDILIELGIYGQIRPACCLVYTRDQGYIVIPDFTNLSIPRWSPNSGTITDEWHHGAAEYGIDRYKVIGTQLILSESLRWIYDNGQNPLYTIIKNDNGKMVTVHKDVPESAVDFDYWYN